MPSPDFDQAGQTVTLSWSSTNATDLDIEPGVGKVAPQGSTPVNPERIDDLHDHRDRLGRHRHGQRARGRERRGTNGGSNAARRTAERTGAFRSECEGCLFFDLDKSDLRADAREALTKDAEFLRSYPQVRVSLEGHCDERGSTEYNLGLGQRRAEAAKNFLISLGITADRVETISWGKERPFCTEHDETCWQQNRRAHFVMAH